MGEILEQLLEVRKQRIDGAIEKGCLLMVGTAAHQTTRESIRWWMGQARENGMPHGKRVVLIGSETDQLEEKDRQRASSIEDGSARRNC